MNKISASSQVKANNYYYIFIIYLHYAFEVFSFFNMILHYHIALKHFNMHFNFLSRTFYTFHSHEID